MPANILEAYIWGMDTAELLRRARQDANLTQVELAAATGLSQPRISAYEAGRVRPSPETLRAILDALKVRPSIKVEIAADEITHIAERHKAVNVRVFGSCVRGTDTEHSDVDLIVDLIEGASTYDIADLIAELEDLLETEVDIVSSDSEFARKFLAESEAL